MEPDCWKSGYRIKVVDLKISFSVPNRVFLCPFLACRNVRRRLSRVKASVNRSNRDSVYEDIEPIHVLIEVLQSNFGRSR